MKLRFFLFLIACFTNLSSLFAELSDSIIKFSDLVFKDNIERNTFRNYAVHGKKADIIDLFLTSFTKNNSYSSSNAHQQILECVNELKTETAGMSDAKKIKTIYKRVHQRFFKLYKLKNSFSDIFELGEYNCVSGSAMYAIIFHYMDIPYQIVEAPQHVFLFAYPNTHKIAIETTSPQHGYSIFPANYVEQFIKYMAEAKLISKDEYESNSVNELFNKYYFATKGLSIQELASVQYSNYSIYLGENNDDKAIEEIKKAYYMNPNERNKYILKSELSYVVSNHSYKDENDVRNLAIFCRFNNISKNDVSDEKIKYEFGRVTQEQLINNSNYLKYEKSYQLIHDAISDTILRDVISFNFHYELARIGYQNSRDKDYELRHLRASYKINPKHADLQSMIKLYFGKRFENSNDATLILTELNELASEFNFLKSDVNCNSIKANCLLELAYQSFVTKNIYRGESFLFDFEKLYTIDGNIKPSEGFIEKAFSTAASYYFKKGNISKTKQILNTGIKYSPNNFGLQVRAKQLR